MINIIEIENTKKSIPKAEKNQKNFILSLLKDEKDPLKLLQKLNISLEEIKDILKHLPQKEKKEFEKIIENLIKYISSNTKDKESFFNDNLFNVITNLSTKQKQEIIKNVKQEIEVKIKTKKLNLPKNILEEFKNIKSLKELIKFANKNHLNIVKVVITKEIKKQQTPSIIHTNNKNNDFIKNVLKEISNSNKTYISNLSKKEVKSDLPIFGDDNNKINDNNKMYDRKTSVLNNLLQTDYKKKSNHKTEKNHNLKSDIEKSDTKKSDLPIFRDIKPQTTIQDNYINKKQEIKNELSLSQFLSQDINKNNYTNKNSDTDIEEENISFHHDTPLQINNIKQTIISSKQSLNHFANNLKEIIENYKPPLQKVSMELHPKELGKVELTLIQRGDNLQIHLTSNQQPTIQFFANHQQELKSILVNMGYNEVNMSFNQNNQHQNQQQQKKYNQNQELFEKEEESFIIEIPYKYA